MSFLSTYQSNTRQSGVTLIELLVSMAIFAVGMLALLGLISNSIALTNSANHSSVASAMAYALADNVRGNPTLLASYDDPAGVKEPDCLTTTGCSSGDLVNTEYQLWLERLKEALPGGVGVVCRDSATSSIDGSPDNWACDDSGGNAVYVIKICWKGTMNSGAWVCYRSII